MTDKNVRLRFRNVDGTWSVVNPLTKSENVIMNSGQTVEEAISSIHMSAEEVTYNNSSYPTVAAALDKLLYVAPSISSFSVSPSLVEKGTVVTNLSFSWGVNKAIVSQSINQGIGSSLLPTDRSLNVSNQSITNGITYTLTVNDGTNQTTRSVSLSFQQKRYWGMSAKDTLANSDVLTLSSEFSTSRAQSRTMNPNNHYLYFAIPSSFGAPSFKVNGLANNAWVKTTLQFTNASGFTESYDVYRSQYMQNGTGLDIDIS